MQSIGVMHEKQPEKEHERSAEKAKPAQCHFIKSIFGVRRMTISGLIQRLLSAPR